MGVSLFFYLEFDMIGNKYVLRKANRDAWLLESFSGVPVKEGSVITILKTVECYFNSKITGVVAIEFDGNEYKFDENHLISWAFFTEDMTNCKEYGIYRLEEFESAGVVGKSVGETEYLMQGKNGLRLQESVDRIRSKVGLVVTKPLEDRYNDWIIENIHVYDLFCKFTLQAIESGKKKISHWLIVNRLRWEVEIETNGMCEQDKDYKISNDYIAFLARDFVKDYPQHSEIFNLKQMKRV